MNTTFKDKTNYSNIYEHTYWGNFDTKFKKLENEIILNRNKFIENFEIKKVKDIPEKIEEFFHLSYDSRNKTNNNFFDHIETYITHNKNYIVITSPYSLQDTTAEILGYKKYNKMYGQDAFTYIKILELN